MSPRFAGRVVPVMGMLAVVTMGCDRSPPPSPAPPQPKAEAGPVKTPREGTTAPKVAEKSRPAPEGPAKPAFEVQPVKAVLAAGDLGLQLIAESAGSHGGKRDLTSEVKWSAEPSGVVAVDADGYVRPMGRGKARVKAVHGKDVVAVEVTVADPSSRDWDFAADVVPILTRSGCNSGACHGKADGQNGFHLSLFGYDPESDYRAVTRDSGGRRVSPMTPEESLLLRKATGRTPHVGGLRLSSNSDEFRTLAAWIKAGVPERKGKAHGALTKVTVEPRDVRLEEPGPQQLRVVAHYADGHDRDVTRLANIRVNDDTAATIDPNGKAALTRRAEVDLIVRYQSSVLSTRIATIINPDLKFDFAKLPRRNAIDVELFKRLESLKVPPSKPATDAAFMRRVTLDLTGQQPEPTDVREFMKDADPEKRAKLVDHLLKSPRFIQFWQIKLGDMLQISQARFQNGFGPYEGWLGQRLRENAPWDVMVRQLLTSLGDPTKRDEGAVNYALDGPDPKVAAEQTAQRFLGLRLRCAQCHDHPFDVWTQDDYYGMAAFFAKIQRGGGGPGGMGKPIVKIDPKGEVEHLRTKKPARPKLPGGKTVEVAEKDDPRKALADWMTARENPFFARAMANWVWAQFFGKGIADPADDLSRSNPPVHPELLDALAAHFVEHKYDLRDLIRTVATSEAYGLSSAPVPGNEHDARFFSHQLARPLTAHQMADAIATVTGVKNRFGDRKDNRLAVEIQDPATPSTILDTFGRCPRVNGCSTNSTPVLSLRQSLLLIGGDVIESKIGGLQGYLASIMAQTPQQSVEEIVENLYFRALCRPPTEEELSHWSAELKGASKLQDATEDLFWALLNSREFAFNH